MTAFVELQEAEFAAMSKGFTAVKHQREVGTSYFDAVTHDDPGQPGVDDGAQELDRGRAVLRRQGRLTIKDGVGVERGAQRPVFASCIRRACKLVDVFCANRRVRTRSDDR